jgi:hypothetical protein
VAHSGRVDMAAIGAKGGSRSPLTKLRKAFSTDEEESVRAQAQDVIRRGLAGDPSVTKTMLDAARSVFSFRAAPAPSEETVPEHRQGGGVFSVRELVALMAERHVLRQLVDISEEDEATVARILGDAKPLGSGAVYSGEDEAA